MIGDGTLGIFDASHADDPTVASRVWRSYSVVDVSPIYGWGAVSTRVGVSDDRGLTFADRGLVNQAEDLDSGFGHNFETSTLVRDASAPSAERWKLVYFHVFNNQAAPGDSWKRYDGTLAWIGMRAAPAPEGPWGPEVKLLAPTINNPQIGGLPRFTSDALMVTEPGAMPDQAGVWLAYQAMIGTAESQIRLLHLSANGQVKLECGSFFTPNDLSLLRVFNASLASMVYMAAPFLFNRNGKSYLGVTPVDANHAYLGVAIFQIAAMNPVRLVKSMGIVPKLVKFLPPVTGFGGAGAYSGQSTGSGIVMSRFSVAQSPMFQLVNTSVQVP